MATPIVVPDAGQTTDEMLLVKWYVAVGQDVKTGDILADIETDKAVAEIEAYASGQVLALLAEEGETVLTGQTLLWLGAAGEAVPEAAVEKVAAAAPEAEVAEVAAERDGFFGGPATGRATPAARTLARERGVELATVAGSGPEGAVVKRDVEAHASAAGDCTPLSPMRRAIAARLQQSVREAPHFYVAMDVDMTQALAARARGGGRERQRSHRPRYGSGAGGVPAAEQRAGGRGAAGADGGERWDRGRAGGRARGPGAGQRGRADAGGDC